MGYDNRMWAKDTANWGVQIAGMFFKHALVLKHKKAGKNALQTPLLA